MTFMKRTARGRDKGNIQQPAAVCIPYLLLPRLLVPVGAAVAGRGAGSCRYVRHPVYARVIIILVCSPPAPVSLWAPVPVMLVSLSRTRGRDLQAVLAGYTAYPEADRYRLLPGLR